MTTTTSPPPAPDPQTLETLRQLVERAQHGDPEVLPALQEALDTYPAIWQRYGDLTRHTEESWLRLLAPEDLLLRESTRRHLTGLREDLLGSQPSPLERQL